MTIYVNVKDLVSNPSLVAMAKDCDIVAMSDDDCFSCNAEEGQEIREWSKKALKTYGGDIEELNPFAMKREIEMFLSRAVAGIALADDPNNYPLPNPLTIKSVLKYVANPYGIEPSDIVKILQTKE